MGTVILLAVDDRDAADAAVRWVAERASHPATNVRVVSVTSGERVLHDPAHAATTRAETTLAAIAPTVHTTVEALDGDVFDTLVRLSEEVDLLVIGSDQSNPLRAFLHASLSGRVASDLVVVPVGWRPPDGPSRILVGWDDEPAGEAAIDAAVAEAVLAGAPVHVVHVWTPNAATLSDPTNPSRFAAALERGERLLLERAVRHARTRHGRIGITSELHRGSVVDGILSQATTAALIVVGTNRRSLVGEIALGSTGDALIRASDRVPILIASTARHPATVES